jgi:Uma2 family endonuclease
VQNEERIRGKPRIDLDVDPPPHLVIEIDITSPSLNKRSIYARMGVPEIWRHDGGRVSIFVLREGEYAVVAESAVEESRSLGSAAWMRRVCEWARTHASPSN